MDKHKAFLRDQKHKFLSERLIQDATQMETTCCDAGNSISDCRRFSMKSAWCVPGGRPRRSWIAAWSNCGTITSLAVEPGEGDGAGAVHMERASRPVYHAEVQHRLQCMAPCRMRVADAALKMLAEAVRGSTSWDHRRHIIQTWIRLASEGHSPSRVSTGGDQSGNRGSSIPATAGGVAACGHGGE